MAGMLQRFLPALLAAMALAPAAAADAPPAAPPPTAASAGAADAQTRAAIEQQRLRFAAVMRPELRTRVIAAARLLDQRLDAPVHANAPPTDPQQAARQIVTDGHSFVGLGGGGADIEALVFIVLMEAAKSTEDDLEAIMGQINGVNAAKACLRATLERTKVRQCMDGIVPSPPLTQAALDTLLAPAKADPSTLDALSQSEALTLQMIMDRRSKLMAALSNVLKKISDTSSSIVQNMK